MRAAYFLAVLILSPALAAGIFLGMHAVIPR